MARPEPSQRLAAAAPWVWTLEAATWAVPLVVGAMVIGGELDNEDGALGTLGGLLPWAALAVALGAVLVAPWLRARRWRWELRDDELDLRRGVVTAVRTVVPLSRIQHVEVRRSFASQLLGAGALVVHTAAGTTTLPVLREDVAASLRDRIADLLHVPDEL